MSIEKEEIGEANFSPFETFQKSKALINFPGDRSYPELNSKIKDNQIGVLSKKGILYIYIEKEVFFFNNNNLNDLVNDSVPINSSFKMKFTDAIEKIFSDENYLYVLQVIGQKSAITKVMIDNLFKSASKETEVFDEELVDADILPNKKYILLTSKGKLYVHQSQNALSTNCKFFKLDSEMNTFTFCDDKSIHIFTLFDLAEKSSVDFKDLFDVSNNIIIHLDIVKTFIFVYTKSNGENDDKVFFIEIDRDKKPIKILYKDDFFFPDYDDEENKKCKAQKAIVTKYIDGPDLFYVVNKQAETIEMFFTFEFDEDRNSFDIQTFSGDDDRKLSSANKDLEHNCFVGLGVIDFKFKGYSEDNQMIDSVEHKSPYLVVAAGFKGGVNTFYLPSQNQDFSLNSIQNNSENIIGKEGVFEIDKSLLNSNPSNNLNDNSSNNLNSNSSNNLNNNPSNNLNNNPSNNPNNNPSNNPNNNSNNNPNNNSSNNFSIFNFNSSNNPSENQSKKEEAAPVQESNQSIKPKADSNFVLFKREPGNVVIENSPRNSSFRTRENDKLKETKKMLISAERGLKKIIKEEKDELLVESRKKFLENLQKKIKFYTEMLSFDTKSPFGQMVIDNFGKKLKDFERFTVDNKKFLEKSQDFLGKKEEVASMKEKWEKEFDASKDELAKIHQLKRKFTNVLAKISTFTLNDQSSLDDILSSEPMQMLFGKEGVEDLKKKLHEADFFNKRYTVLNEDYVKLKGNIEEFEKSLKKVKEESKQYQKLCLMTSKFSMDENFASSTSRYGFEKEMQNNIFLNYMRVFEIFLYNLDCIYSERVKQESDLVEKETTALVEEEKNQVFNLSSLIAENITVNSKKNSFEDLSRILMRNRCEVTYPNKDKAKTVEELFSSEQDETQSKVGAPGFGFANKSGGLFGHSNEVKPGSGNLFGSTGASGAFGTGGSFATGERSKKEPLALLPQELEKIQKKITLIKDIQKRNESQLKEELSKIKKEDEIISKRNEEIESQVKAIQERLKENEKIKKENEKKMSTMNPRQREAILANQSKAQEKSRSLLGASTGAPVVKKEAAKPSQPEAPKEKKPAEKTSGLFGQQKSFFGDSGTQQKPLFGGEGKEVKKESGSLFSTGQQKPLFGAGGKEVKKESGGLFSAISKKEEAKSPFSGQGSLFASNQVPQKEKDKKEVKPAEQPQGSHSRLFSSNSQEQLNQPSQERISLNSQVSFGPEEGKKNDFGLSGITSLSIGSGKKSNEQKKEQSKPEAPSFTANNNQTNTTNSTSPFGAFGFSNKKGPQGDSNSIFSNPITTKENQPQKDNASNIFSSKLNYGNIFSSSLSQNQNQTQNQNQNQNQSQNKTQNQNQSQNQSQGIFGFSTSIKPQAQSTNLSGTGAFGAKMNLGNNMTLGSTSASVLNKTSFGGQTSGPSPFGTQSTSTSPFGAQTTSTSPFGTFGQTKATSASSNPFGIPQKPEAKGSAFAPQGQGNAGNVSPFGLPGQNSFFTKPSGNSKVNPGDGDYF